MIEAINIKIEKAKKLQEKAKNRTVLPSGLLSEGTCIHGDEDRSQDGSDTRRQRRKVIVLKQKRGTSLDLTLQESSELKNLGLTFEKWQV